MGSGHLLLLKAPSVLETLRKVQSIFEEFDLLIKSHVAKNPQRMTIWVPEGTSQEAIAGRVAQAKQVDPKVPVDVRYYKHPPQGESQRH